MNTKAIIAIVLAVVAVGLVAIFFFAGGVNDEDVDDTTTQEETTANGEAETTPGDDPRTIDDGSDEVEGVEGTTVRYSSSGFAPATLTVSVGGTVSFMNGSNTNMWVASDPHPIHNDYPDFDAGRGYAPGDTYEFTFTKTGTYGYHDHLNPTRGGTIVVE